MFGTPEEEGAMPPEELELHGDAACAEAEEDLDLGSAQNAILAYLSQLGKDPLLSREEERDLAIAMEEGTRRIYRCLARIPFARDLLLAFPQRLTSGEIPLTDISILEESSHEDWTPSLTEELCRFAQRVAALAREDDPPQAGASRGARQCESAESDRLGDELYRAYSEFRFGAGILRVVLRTLWAQLGRLSDPAAAPDPQDRTDATAFGMVDLDQGVIFGAARASRAEHVLGLGGAALMRAIEELTAAHRQVHEARSRMIRSNLRLVVSIAKHFANRGIPLLDLVQEGNIGLMKAVSRFNWRLGHKFSTYATWWIRQAISRCLAEHGRTIRVPIHLVECLSKVHRTRARLRQDLDREPTLEEVARAAGYTVEQIERAERVLVRTVSLDMPLGEDDGELRDLVEDAGAEHPFDGAVTADLQVSVRRLLAGLTPKEEAVIRLRYGIGASREHTLEEVGAAVHLTRERVRQIEMKALSRLRHPAFQKGLASFIED